MGMFKKKHDPISDRARALNEQIAALEEEIQRLSTRQSQASPPTSAQPRLRSTAIPHGPTLLPSANTGPHPAVSPEPVFEEFEQNRLDQQSEAAPPEHFNELGVRKYDLAGAWQRLKNQFRGPATSNPKLVNYLAAGSIQGLRPLRYEKRVARNRFLVLVIFLVLALWGTIYVYFRWR
jgi:hypothetical protein